MPKFKDSILQFLGGIIEVIYQSEYDVICICFKGKDKKEKIYYRVNAQVKKKRDLDINKVLIGSK